MSNKLTNWHDAKVRKPAEGERVLVVRKSFFWEAYYVDIAKYEGGKFRCGGATPKVTYWSYLPDTPNAEEASDER